MQSLLQVLAFCLASSAFTSGSGAPRFRRDTTHRTRSFPNGYGVKSYHPDSTFEIYDRAIELSSHKRNGKDKYADAGLTWMKKHFGKEATLHSHFQWTTSSHVYAKQYVNGMAVANTLAAVTMDPSGNVVSSSSSFVKLDASSVKSATPRLSTADAVHAASTSLNGEATGNADPKLEYYAHADGKVALTYAVRLHLTDSGEFVDAFVDADSGEVVGMMEYSSDLQMQAVPLGKTDPFDGYALLVDTEDRIASPSGWSSVDGEEIGGTFGNNAWAFKANVTAVRDSLFGEKEVKEFAPELVKGLIPESSKGRYAYAYNTSADPTTKDNIAAATVNVWQVANRAHDILYRYGFMEQCFNFQFAGDDTVGKNGDPVWISVQDSSGINNARFTTFGDGVPGLMSMFLWNLFENPTLRDSAVANSVILHEYAHGLSQRLTGGGTARCLQTTQSRGLGEGWSDAFADWVVQSSFTERPVKDFKVGEFLNQPGRATLGGLRTFPYSANRTVNPQTFEDIGDLEEVHDIGEIWAQALHVVHNALVNSLGSATSSNEVFTHPEKENGHSVFMHLLISALAMQPCNPTILQARLAWIQADQLMFAGNNTCNLWLAFAYSGLGVGAKEFKNDFTVPERCPLTLKFFVDPPADFEYP